MKDLLLDTGRVGGGWGKGTSRRFHFKNDDSDDLPHFISTARKRQGSYKHQGDRLNPLKRYLRKNCGRPWADVYAEICEFADSRTIRGYHLRQHGWNYVVPNNYDVGHRRSYGPFFVDPQGILQEERRLTLKERRAQWKRSPYNTQKPDNPRLSVDADHYWERIDGIWYWFAIERWTEPCSYQDLVQEGGEVKIITVKLRDRECSKTTKRQVNSKTQKELNKKWVSQTR